MRRVVRELRRAPARIITAVFALGLALGAIGVFAIPTVAASSLRDAAVEDGLPQVVLRTQDTGGVDAVALLESLDGVERAELQVESVVPLGDGAEITLHCVRRTMNESKCLGGSSERAGTLGAVRFSQRWGHGCVSFADGTMACWGSNTWGEVGHGTFVDRSDAVSVALTEVVDVATAFRGSHSCAIVANGDVDCWGRNDVGQLGIDGIDGTADPIRVPGL